MLGGAGMQDDHQTAPAEWSLERQMVSQPCRPCAATLPPLQFNAWFARQSTPRVVTETHEQGPLVYFDALL